MAERYVDIRDVSKIDKGGFEMTKEQAIKTIKEHCYFANLIPDAKKALDMAIDALEQQPSEDCVSRYAVVEYIKASDAELGHDCENELVVEDILNMPPVTPTHKVGKWIEVWEGQRDEYTGEYDEWSEYKCSVCGFQEFDADRFKYCPNCGAEMRGNENG